MTEKPNLEALKNRIQELEDLLRQSENRFRLLLKNSSDIQVIIDEKGVERYVSESVEVMTGFPPEAFMGKSGFEFIHPEDIPGLVAAFEELKRGKSDSVSAEYRHMKKDGSWLTLEGIGNNLLDDPAIKGVVLNVRDVTKERAAEKDLRESEFRLKSTFAAAPVGLAIMKEREFLAVNRSYCEIMGYSASELIGRTTRRLYESEAERVRVGQDLYGRLWQKGLAVTETRHIRKDGEIRDISLRASPVDLEDPSMGVVVAIEDITQRRQTQKALKNSEERYRSIIENIQEGYYEVDLEGSFTFCNEAMRNILGYEEQEMLRDSTTGILRMRSMPKSFTEHLTRCIRTGSPQKALTGKLFEKTVAFEPWKPPWR